MEAIFEPKNEKELELVRVIRFSNVLNERKKAIKQLRVICGLDPKDPLCGLRSIEYYDRIPNKPPTWKRFRIAMVVYDTCKLKR